MRREKEGEEEGAIDWTSKCDGGCAGVKLSASIMEMIIHILRLVVTTKKIEVIQQTASRQ